MCIRDSCAYNFRVLVCAEECDSKHDFKTNSIELLIAPFHSDLLRDDVDVDELVHGLFGDNISLEKHQSVSLSLASKSTVYWKQEAFEKCWAHSPQRAASRQFTRCRYCTVARRLRIDVHNDDDNDDDDDDDDDDNDNDNA